VLEATLYFMKRGYEVLPLTSENGGALRQLAERRSMDWIEHPPLGGRFSGLAETALAPCVFAGIDAGAIRKGAEEMYGRLAPENNYNAALNVASAVHDAEQKGYDKVFAPFYSSRMFGLMPLFIQLVHETVAKDGQGPFVAGDHAPEFQHHTNQRIFGGPEDVLTFFFRTENHEREHVEVPDDIADVGLRGREMSELDGLELQESLRSEYEGVKGALDDEDMPSITLTVTELSHRSMGKIVAFLQYMPFYLAKLYGVNPFTQPDVEKAKKMGFESRFRER
jgi:glucose-6-phosphate isomerase